MSRTIDERVVEMQFDNRNFESNVKTSMSTLDKLKNSLDFSGNEKAFQKLNKSVNDVSFDGLTNGLTAVQAKFSAMQVAAMTIISNITNAVMNAITNIARKITSPIISGGIRRALNIEQAKFQFEGLGMDIEAAMKSANDAVSGTAYGLDAAAKVASQLGASGMQAGEEMTRSLRAVAGVAAMTGSSYEEIGNIFTTVAGNGRLMSNQLLQMSSRGLNAAASIAEYFNSSAELMDEFYEKYTKTKKKSDETIQKGTKATERAIRTMVTNGAIDFQTFSDAMDYAFGEHAKDANKTFAGSLSNVKAALSRIGAELATPSLTALRDIFNALIPVINNVKKGLKPLFVLFESFVGSASKKVVAFLNGFKDAKYEFLSPMFVSLARALMKFRDALKLVGDAWEYIFPKKGDGEKRLYEFWKNVRAFTGQRKLFRVQIENLKDAFKGLFAILDLILEPFRAIFRLIKEYILPSFGDFTSDVLGVGGALGRAAVEFRDFVKSGDLVYETFKNIIGLGITVISGALNGIDKALRHLRDTTEDSNNIFGLFINGILDIYAAIVDADFGRLFHDLVYGYMGDFKQWFNTLYVDSGAKENFEKLADKFSWVGDIISAVVDGVGKAIDTFKGYFKDLGFFDGFVASCDEMADGLEKVVEPATILEGIFAGIGFAIETIINVVGTLIGAAVQIGGGVLGEIVDLVKQLIGALTDGDLDKFLTLLETGLLIDAFKKLRATFKKFDDFVKSNTIVSLFDQLTNSLFSLEQHVKIKNIESIGKAILMLGAGLFIISSIKEEDLGRSLGAVVTLLGALTIPLGKLMEGFKIPDVKEFGEAITLLTGSLGMFLKAEAVATIIKALATSVILLAIAMKIISGLSIGDIAKSLIAIVVLMETMVRAFKKLENDKGALVSGTRALISFGIAIQMLAIAMRIIGGMSFEDMSKSVLAIASVTYIMVKALDVLGANERGIAKGSRALIAYAFAMDLLAISMRIIGGMEGLELATSIVGIYAVTGIMVGALKTLAANDKGIAKGSIALVAFAIAMDLLSIAMRVIGSMDILDAAQAVIGIYAVTGIMVGAITALSATKGKSLIAAASMLIMAAAFDALVPSLALMGSLPLKVLAKGIVAMAAAFTVMGIAGKLITPSMVVTIIGLAGSFALFGAGVAAIGVGIALIGAGLISIAAGITALGGSAAALELVIIGLFTGLIKGVSQTVTAVIDLFKKLFIEAKKLIGPVVELVVTTVREILKAVREVLPDLLETVGIVINSVLDFLIEQGPVIFTKVVTLLISVCDTIANNAEDIVTHAGEMFLSIFEKAIDWLGNNEERLKEDIEGFLINLLSIVAEIAYDVWKAGWDFASDFIDGILDGIKQRAQEVWDAISNLLSRKSNDQVSWEQDAELGLTAYDELFGSGSYGKKYISSQRNPIADAWGAMIIQATKDLEPTAIASAEELEDAYNKGLITEMQKNMRLNQFGILTNEQFKEWYILYETEGAEDAAAYLDSLNMEWRDGMVQFKEVVEETTSEAIHGGASSPIVKNAMSTYQVNIENLAKNIPDSFSKQKSKSESAVASIFNAVKNRAKDQSLISAFAESGKYMIDGLIKGISSNVSRATSTIAGVGTKLLTSFNKSVVIKSPSRAFAESGKYIDLGLVKGIEDNAHEVYNASEELGLNAFNAINSAISAIEDGGEPVIRPVMDLTDIENGVNKASDLMSDMTMNTSMDNAANAYRTYSNPSSYQMNDMYSKLSSLVATLNGNSGNSTVNNTFNITNDDPREVANQVSRIIQQQVERRATTWA